jgi:hypothetical protein
MERKQVTVECPCCESRLEVDVLTAKVMRWREKAEPAEPGEPRVGEGDWDAAAERVSRRTETARDRFDESLSREKSRSKDLDDLFRKAADKARDQEDD